MQDEKRPVRIASFLMKLGRAFLLFLMTAGIPALVGIALSTLLTLFGETGSTLQRGFLGLGMMLSLFMIMLSVPATGDGLKEFTILWASGFIGFSIGIGLTSQFGLSWSVVIYSLIASQIVPWSTVLVYVSYMALSQRNRKR